MQRVNVGSSSRHKEITPVPLQLSSTLLHRNESYLAQRREAFRCQGLTPIKSSRTGSRGPEDLEARACQLGALLFYCMVSRSSKFRGSLLHSLAALAHNVQLIRGTTPYDPSTPALHTFCNHDTYPEKYT